MAKKIQQGDIIGEQGIALIHQRVSAMGLLWYPTGGVEAGIDGRIEMRDPTTGEVFNAIVQVQSKATSRPWTAETADGFEYLCKPEDLDYWLNGNAPVILVVSRPSTQEAYWVSINTYFSDLTRRQARKIFFDKRRDRFDESCRDALVRLAVPRTSGIYLAPVPKTETLYSNLLAVTSFAEHVYVAETDHRHPGDVRAAFREMNLWPGREWVLKNKQIISFHDLDEYPWNTICDVGTLECFAADEWAYADDPDRQREWVWLLNQALQEKVQPKVRYSKEHDCYFFRATPNLDPRRFTYTSLTGRSTSRDVFLGYASRNPARAGQTGYYRHSAFSGQFVCFDEHWYLDITPTYYFTLDGSQPFSYYEDKLKGIKRLERNQAVLGQVVMWARYLTQPPDLFTPRYPFLEFGDLQRFDILAGFDDDQWLRHEDEEEEQATTEAWSDLPLARHAR